MALYGTRTLFTALFFCCAPLSALAGPTFTCNSALLKSATALGPGEEVRISFSLPDGKSQRLKALVLGRNYEDGMNYFYDVGDKRIVEIPIQDTHWTSGQSGVAEPALPDLEIRAQVGGTCAVHSTMNCIGFLQNHGFLKNHELGAFLQESNGWTKVFRTINDSKVNAEAPARLAEERAVERANEGLGFWQRVFNGSRVTHQWDVRADLLKEMGLETTILDSAESGSMDKLIAHVSQGRPAILDVRNTKFAKKDVFDLGTGEDHQTQAIFPAENSKYAEGHSVTAIGYIKTGWFSGKLLVLDSNDGSFSLWAKDDLKKAGGKWTLVSPGSGYSPFARLNAEDKTASKLVLRYLENSGNPQITFSELESRFGVSEQQLVNLVTEHPDRFHLGRSADDLILVNSPAPDPFSEFQGTSR